MANTICNKCLSFEKECKGMESFYSGCIYFKKKVPYKLKDQEGNTFVFAGYENGHPLYRTGGGSKHIFESDIKFYEIVQMEE